LCPKPCETRLLQLPMLLPSADTVSHIVSWLPSGQHLPVSVQTSLKRVRQGIFRTASEPPLVPVGTFSTRVSCRRSSVSPSVPPGPLALIRMYHFAAQNAVTLVGWGMPSAARVPTAGIRETREVNDTHSCNSYPDVPSPQLPPFHARRRVGLRFCGLARLVKICLGH
jgi:hypothetical protein